jgi:hypothetical protein
MRLAITGGREFNNVEFVVHVLNNFADHHTITCMTAGKARGVDTIAELWAKHKNIKFDHSFKAEWSIYGDAAGPIRNQAILDIFKPDAGIVFPGGTGTADMLTRMKRYKRKVNPRFYLFQVDPIWEFLL